MERDKKEDRFKVKSKEKLLSMTADSRKKYFTGLIESIHKKAWKKYCIRNKINKKNISPFLFNLLKMDFNRHFGMELMNIYTKKIKENN